MAWSTYTVTQSALAGREPGTFRDTYVPDDEVMAAARATFEDYATRYLQGFAEAYGCTVGHLLDELAGVATTTDLYRMTQRALAYAYLAVYYDGAFVAPGNADDVRAERYRKRLERVLPDLESAIRIALREDEITITGSEVTRDEYPELDDRIYVI